MHLAPGRIALWQVNVALPLAVPVAGREANQHTKRYHTVQQAVQFHVLRQYTSKILAGVVCALVSQTHNKASACFPGLCY